MSNAEWWRRAGAVLLTWVATTGALQAASGQPGDRSRVVVRIENHASVPAGILAAARIEAAGIFAPAGFEVTWLEPAAVPSGEDGIPLTLRLVNLETAAGNPRSSMLGMAARPHRHAFVFYNRITDVAPRGSSGTAMMLGRVMAHELGHLLLPPGPHAHHGPMRAEISATPAGPITFSAEEARRMREALSGAPRAFVVRRTGEDGA